MILGRKTFDKKNAAIAWATRLETAAGGGLDVHGGQAKVKALMKEWIEVRRDWVVEGTFAVDLIVQAKLTPTLKARAIASITPSDLEKWYIHLRKKHDLGDGSLKRYRESLSSFFKWTVDDNRRGDNPVRRSKLPAVVDPPNEMHPFSRGELKTIFDRCSRFSEHNAKIIYILGWTGLRWGEAWALPVRDVILDGMPYKRVTRSQTETRKLKSTKGRTSRTVPIVDEVLPFVRELLEDTGLDDLVFTGPKGGKLWRQSCLISTHYEEVGMGRTLHDLRHSAACIWLTEEVDLSTLKAWLGHASVATTNLYPHYLHHLGTTADQAALKKLNS
ncbi:hypothetical protein GCM10009813_35250 [Brevibacterium marinum]